MQNAIALVMLMNVSTMRLLPSDISASTFMASMKVVESALTVRLVVINSPVDTFSCSALISQIDCLLMSCYAD